MTQREHPDTVIARLARGQHGLLTIGQARSSGVTYGQIRHRVRLGSLVRLDQGTYAVSSAPPTWQQRAVAALLTVGGDALLYRWSAARAWRLDVPETTRIELATVASRSWRADSARIALHRLTHLDRADRDRTDGLPVTSPARTLIDIAAKLDSRPLGQLVDAALSRQLLTPMELEAALRRLSGRGRSHAHLVRDALGPWLDGGAFDSVAEAACLRAMECAGLPAPVRQHPVKLPDGDQAKIDFAWPAAMVALEVDGYRWHANPRSHARDSVRANALEAAGWTVLRATPTELADRPRHVMEALRRRLHPLIAGRV